MRFKIFSEAYDIIPKNDDDVDAIKHLDDNQKEKVKELLSTVKKKSGKKDPLALSPSSNEKGIKIQRAAFDDIDADALSKQSGFKLSAGDGSRGGGGSKSKGFAILTRLSKIYNCILHKVQMQTLNFQI